MEPITKDSLMLLAQRLGERLEAPLRLYLLGGSAMLLLGSPRATKDVDYDLDTGGEDADAPRLALEALATELRLDLEFVPLAGVWRKRVGGGFADVRGERAIGVNRAATATASTGPDRALAPGSLQRTNTFAPDPAGLPDPFYG